MLSASSSSSSSQRRMSCSICAVFASSSFSFSITFASRSKSFIANQRCCSSGKPCKTASSMCARACSTSPEKLCAGDIIGKCRLPVGANCVRPPFTQCSRLSAGEHSSPLQLAVIDDASSAVWAASVTPVPLSADISTTGQPSAFDRLADFSSEPFFCTTSIIFTATTTGMPSSISCVVRYKLRSRFVPSTMFKIASGRSSIK